MCLTTVSFFTEIVIRRIKFGDMRRNFNVSSFPLNTVITVYEKTTLKLIIDILFIFVYQYSAHYN